MLSAHESEPAEVERRYLLSLPSPASRNVMRRCIGRLVQLCGGDWARLTRLDVLRTVRRLDGLGLNTAKQHICCLRGLLRAADVDPRIVDGAKPPRGTVEPAGRALPETEQRALEGACRTDRDRAMVALMLFGGLRVSELVGANVADLDVRGATLLVRGKAKKQRRVALGPSAMQAVRAAVGGRVDGPLLVTRTDERMAARGVQATLKAIAKRAGIAHVSPHDLRRTCVTSAVERGAPLAAVATHVGHASVATTQLYLRADPVEQSRAVAAALG